ncbi:MAG: PEGA domain-containing protein [Syntrophotaleaceae bacterium]
MKFDRILPGILLFLLGVITACSVSVAEGESSNPTVAGQIELNPTSDRNPRASNLEKSNQSQVGAKELSTFDLHTEPSGGQVLIVETNRLVEDGGRVSLPAGRYRLRPMKEGYRPKEVTIDVREATDETILIHLGKGYAPLLLTSSPSEGEVTIDGVPRGRTPLKTEVEEGDHLLSVTVPSYQQEKMPFTVGPGESRTFHFDLKKIPTHGRVQIQTSMAGASIFVDGKLVGKGRADLPAVPFGSHRVQATLHLDAVTRLVAEAGLTISEAENHLLQLQLTVRERLFKGRWMAESEALAQEDAHYRAHKVANPVTLHARLTPEALQMLREKQDADRFLHEMMRVGDRLLIEGNGGKWNIWKRSPELTPDFKLLVGALQSGRPVQMPWKKEKEVRSSVIKIGSDVLPALAFGLHEARTVLPLLHLAGGQIGARGETLQRNPGDGEITLLVLGGDDLVLPGKVAKPGEGLSLARIPAGKGQLQLQWQVSPKRVLAISDADAPFSLPSALEDLQINEKRILPIASQVKVGRLVRWTTGPDYQGWKRQEFTTSGPFADQLDLSRDEIGPHERSGAYRRLWLVIYSLEGGSSQRQVEASYQVIDQLKDNRSDRFFRRDGLSGG